MKIKKINIGSVKPTWDIEVPKANHYIMENGCVSHNSARVFGSYEMTEPITSNLMVRKVTQGEFTISNPYLISDLEELGIWSEELKNEIMVNDGSIQKVNFMKYLDSEIKGYEKKIKRIEKLLLKYKTVWEISQKDLINMAADRAPFVDQSQSMNIYMKEPTIGKVTSSHFHAFEKGLKTGCYYFKTQSASSGAKHLAMDVSEASAVTSSSRINSTNSELATKSIVTVGVSNKLIEQEFNDLPPKPTDSIYDCFGCSS